MHVHYQSDLQIVVNYWLDCYSNGQLWSPYDRIVQPQVPRPVFLADHLYTNLAGHLFTNLADHLYHLFYSPVTSFDVS